MGNTHQDIVKLALDTRHGRVENFSARKSADVLRNELVALNGGNTKLTYKNTRGSKGEALFAVIEDILSVTTVEGLQEDDHFMTLVDFRNLAEGDQNEFVVQDSNLFVVSEIADGLQGVRRQRLGGETTTTIPTTLKAIKIYEDLNRVLSGRVDFNTFIDKVSASMKQRLLNDVYSLWASATAQDMGGTAYFPAAGTYNEDELLELIAHVQAAAGGKQATILSTVRGAKHLAPSVQGTDSQSDLYNKGYYANFYGTPIVITPQRHSVGTTDFVFDDSILTIVAGDEKPIKCVYEGESIMFQKEASQNADLTQEYMYGEKYGMGIVLAGGNSGIGRYTMG